METLPKRSQAFFAVIFVFIIYLFWLMAKPMLGSLIFGCILAGVFFPLNLKIEKRFKINRTNASLLTCLLIIVLVLCPIIFISFNVSKEAVGLYQKIISGLGQKDVHNFFFGDGVVAVMIKKANVYLPFEMDPLKIKSTLLSFAEGASGGILKSINSLVGNFFKFIFDLIIMLIVSFGLLVKGDYLKNFIFKLSPLPDEQEQKILNKFNQMNYVTLVCNGVGGLIQGVLGGIALWSCGISSVFLWTTVMIILAFIPLVGISFVTIPASLYLLLTGNIAVGLFLLTFTMIVSLVVENWFKPKFIGDRIQIDSTLVLLTIIGGMSVFGMAGIFYGPIIGILFLTVVEIYHDSYI